MVASAAASGAGGVVGGRPVSVDAAPWAVYVRDESAAGVLACSGSVIGASEILTAAHCLYDESGRLAPPSDLSVLAGVSNVSAPVATDAEQAREVRSVRIHPGYSWASRIGPDDVAVLTLSTPLELGGPDVRAIALPSGGEVFPAGKAVALAGFGEERPGEPESGQLEWMTAMVDPQGSCGTTVGEETVLADDAIRLCAASPSSVPCEGDSGAGLLSGGSTPILLGVLSGGPAVCAAGDHSVFAYLGAPEILGFIRGEARPPTAPRQTPETTASISWAAPLAVGSTLRCASRGWADGPVRLRYALVTGRGRTLQAGSRASFTLSAAVVGESLFCQVSATNAGGTAVARTAPTPPVGPRPGGGAEP
jgi:hypothetical protein